MTKIIKLPAINGLGKTKGCEKAPEAILSSLREVHSSEAGKTISFADLDIEDVEIDNNNVVEANKIIYDKAFESFGQDSKNIFAGGDHSVSYSTTRAFFDFCQNSGKEPCLIVFDAHPDIMPAMPEPTHEEWLRQLIEDGFPTENILLVGVRNSWKTEKEFLKQKNIRMISINQIQLDLEDACDIIMEFSKGKALYISIDIDVIDPAFAPATGYCEPGGLSSREMIYIASRMSKIQLLRAVDVVEVNPSLPGANLTSKLAGKILAELI